MHDWLRKIFDLLFPRRCAGCGADGTFLCEACLAKAPRADADLSDIESALSYAYAPVRHAIHLLKYKNARELGKVFAGPLYETLIPELSRMREFREIWKDEPLIIVPIPLHKRRLRERGYNQSELLAQALCERLQTVSFMQARCVSDVLYKTRATESQVKIKDRARRLVNLTGAFAVRDAERIRGKTVVLLDDVYTTGATMREASKALKRAGAKRVLMLTLAH